MKDNIKANKEINLLKIKHNFNAEQVMCLKFLKFAEINKINYTKMLDYFISISNKD